MPETLLLEEKGEQNQKHLKDMNIRNIYKILVAKPVGKTPLGRSRCRWENIRMHLREIGGKVWTGFIWHRIGTSGGLF